MNTNMDASPVQELRESLSRLFEIGLDTEDAETGNRASPNQAMNFALTQLRLIREKQRSRAVVEGSASEAAWLDSEIDLWDQLKAELRSIEPEVERSTGSAAAAKIFSLMNAVQVSSLSRSENRKHQEIPSV